MEGTLLFVFIGVCVGVGLSYVFGVRRLMQTNQTLREDNVGLKTAKTMLEEQLPKMNEAQAQKVANLQREALLKANETTLKPVKDEFESIRKQMERLSSQSTKERADLKTQFDHVLKQTHQLDSDARALTEALRGENKKQGQWGEAALARLLEYSGLVKGKHYELQPSYHATDADKNYLRPDAVIHLPEKKHLIIDAKVSLVAYFNYVESENETEQTSALNELKRSMVQHINELSARRYAHIEQLSTPDYVFMFISPESAYQLALQKWSIDLMEYAWKKKVTLVGPSTLIASMQIVSSLWRLADQQENIRRIADRGGALYDKLASFMDYMNGIGASLDKAKGAYEDAYKVLGKGRGNVLRQAEMLKQLGVPIKKEIAIREDFKGDLDVLSSADGKEETPSEEEEEGHNRDGAHRSD